jgi:hypothetical protein
VRYAGGGTRSAVGATSIAHGDEGDLDDDDVNDVERSSDDEAEENDADVSDDVACRGRVSHCLAGREEGCNDQREETQSANEESSAQETSSEACKEMNVKHRRSRARAETGVEDVVAD